MDWIRESQQNVERKINVNITGELKMTEIRYIVMAEPGNAWRIYKILPGLSDAIPMGDVGRFDSYEDAESVAKGMADGKYPEWHSGKYISNR